MNVLQASKRIRTFLELNEPAKIERIFDDLHEHFEVGKSYNDMITYVFIEMLSSGEIICIDGEARLGRLAWYRLKAETTIV